MSMANRRVTGAALAATMMVAVPGGAYAQQAQATPAPPFVVRWSNGVSVESTDGDNKLQFGGLIQVDGRFDVSDPSSAVTDTFVLRRVRPILQGRAAKLFEFRLMPDFGNGTTVLSRSPAPEDRRQARCPRSRPPHSRPSSRTAAAPRTRVSPAVFVYHKAFGAFGEYVRSTQAVARGVVHADIANSAWEVTGLVVVTGENASDRGVAPKKPFNPAGRQWGALQLAARYASLQVDPQAFALGLASTGSSRRASAAGMDATWYPSASVKYVLSYERTIFDDNAAGPRNPEHAIVLRLQFNLQPSL